MSTTNPESDKNIPTEPQAIKEHIRLLEERLTKETDPKRIEANQNSLKELRTRLAIHEHGMQG